MDLFFWNRPKFEQLYNCSDYDIEDIPLSQRTHVLFGGLFIGFYCACTVLYVPCIGAMLASEHRNRASYQLMIFMGLMHLVGMFTSTLATGVLAEMGAVFCTAPTLIYFSGMLGLMSWCGSTMTSLVLGVNRCCELHGSLTADRFFGGWRKRAWLVFLFCYFMVGGLTKPLIFNGLMMTWYFNPHYGYIEDNGLIYTNNFHTGNNVVVCTAHTAVYVVFIYLYLKKTYVQIIAIGLVHFIASSMYVMQQFLQVNFYSSLVASCTWAMSQGIPPIIYIIFNRTIRRSLTTLLFHRAGRVSTPGTAPARNGTHKTTSDLASGTLH